MAGVVIPFPKRPSRALTVIERVEETLDKWDFDFDTSTVERQGCTEHPTPGACGYDCAYPDHASYRKCPACPRRQNNG